MNERLDHLLSKEKWPKGYYSGQYKEKNECCSILRAQPSNGGVAQLGEHLPCTQGVRSSILLISTTGNGRIAQVVRAHA